VSVSVSVGTIYRTKLSSLSALNREAHALKPEFHGVRTH
jgi:hypothetical protein